MLDQTKWILGEDNQWQLNPLERKRMNRFIALHFKNDKGQPLIASPRQTDLFAFIFLKAAPRGMSMNFTRWGKSMIGGTAVDMRVCTVPERWAIVAGTKEKARIIMDHCIRHIFDNDYIACKFVPDRGENIENIRRYRNKNRLTFRHKDGRLGEIFIGSAKEALGYGAQNVLVDESALIDDVDFGMIVRMLGDAPDDNFMFQFGNPFQRNHFLKAHNNPKYVKFVVDCYEGLNDGRITQSVIDENKEFRFFSVLFECKFPAPEEIDDIGWGILITEEEIQGALDRKLEPRGVMRLGVDVARGGGCKNVWVIRRDNYAEVIREDSDNDLMSVSGTTKTIIDDMKLDPTEVFIDGPGIGGGVVDRLREQGYRVNFINGGEGANDPDCANVRADLYAGKEGVVNWLRSYGSLKPHPDWIPQGTAVRFKRRSNGKIQIEPKVDARARGIESPDTLDSLSLTFAQKNNLEEVNNPTPEQMLGSAIKPFFPGIDG